ncbi:MAG: hypothetical protein EOO54_21985 [Haliea sp.]|nr:MAG: hypothetical protein EOO54_21985 [Haliea sp.]
MIHTKISTLLTTLTAACLLTACGGGGGSIDDGTTPLRTEGQSITVQSTTDSCPAVSDGVIVYVFGGVAPYTLRNTVPDRVSLSRTKIDDAGGGVEVKFLGGCLTNVPLVVTDKYGATVTVPLNYLPATV